LYWVLLGVNGLYWVVRGVTGFYWICCWLHPIKRGPRPLSPLNGGTPRKTFGRFLKNRYFFLSPSLSLFFPSFVGPDHKKTVEYEQRERERNKERRATCVHVGSMDWKVTKRKKERKKDRKKERNLFFLSLLF